MERMQEFVDCIFYEVWCNAPAHGAFSLSLFDCNQDLKEVMEAFYYSDAKGADFFYGHVERIYNLFAALEPAQIDQFRQWYRGNNDLENVCANDPSRPLARYADLSPTYEVLSQQLASFFKGLYSKSLLGLAPLKTKIGDIDDHYQAFVKENSAGKCPFCGIADLQGEYHSTREAYDHYLPKGLYPFNSINFRNLVPACHHCNSSYKTSKDPAYTPKDPAGTLHRRRFFYPYSSSRYSINIGIDLKKADLDRMKPEDLNLQFGPEELSEEIEAWNDVYGIKERYIAKCLSPDAKDWLEQLRILNHEYGVPPKGFIKSIREQTERSQLSNSNFLKLAFLEGCERAGIFEPLEVV
jgi:hypothetical protein